MFSPPSSFFNITPFHQSSPPSTLQSMRVESVLYIFKQTARDLFLVTPVRAELGCLWRPCGCRLEVSLHNLRPPVLHTVPARQQGSQWGTIYYPNIHRCRSTGRTTAYIIAFRSFHCRFPFAIGFNCGCSCQQFWGIASGACKILRDILASLLHRYSYLGIRLDLKFRVHRELYMVIN